MTHDPADDWDVNDYDDLPTVCVTHLRFIPCRGTAWRENPCQISTHPDAVAAVRNHHQVWDALDHPDYIYEKGTDGV